MQGVLVFGAAVMVTLLILSAFVPGSPRQQEQVWLTQCAQHRPLQDCREDWNALKREQ